MYEGVAGRLAYDSQDPFELVEQAASCAYRPLDPALRAQLPQLCTLIDEMLAPSPEDRPASADIVEQKLDALLLSASEARSRLDLSLRVQTSARETARHLQD